MSMRWYIKLCASVGVVALLTACGGGGGSSSSSAVSTQGSATKGILRQAEIALYTFDQLDPTLNTPLVETSTNDDGTFEFTLPASYADSPIYVVARATSATRMVCDLIAGCDGVDFGALYTPTEGTLLLSAVHAGLTSENTLHLSVLTHMAAQDALYQFAQTPDGDVATLVAAANNNIKNLFELTSHITSFKALDITDNAAMIAESDDVVKRVHLLNAAMLAYANENAQDADLFNNLGAFVQRYAQEGIGLSTSANNALISLSTIMTHAQQSVSFIENQTSEANVLSNLNTYFASRTNLGEGTAQTSFSQVAPNAALDPNVSDATHARNFVAELRNLEATFNIDALTPNAEAFVEQAQASSFLQEVDSAMVQRALAASLQAVAEVAIDENTNAHAESLNTNTGNSTFSDVNERGLAVTITQKTDSIEYTLNQTVQIATCLYWARLPEILCDTYIEYDDSFEFSSDYYGVHFTDVPVSLTMTVPRNENGQGVEFIEGENDSLDVAFTADIDFSTFDKHEFTLKSQEPVVFLMDTDVTVLKESDEVRTYSETKPYNGYYSYYYSSYQNRTDEQFVRITELESETTMSLALNLEAEIKHVESNDRFEGMLQFNIDDLLSSGLVYENEIREVSYYDNGSYNYDYNYGTQEISDTRSDQFYQGNVGFSGRLFIGSQSFGLRATFDANALNASQSCAHSTNYWDFAFSEKAYSSAWYRAYDAWDSSVECTETYEESGELTFDIAVFADLDTETDTPIALDGVDTSSFFIRNQAVYRGDNTWDNTLQLRHLVMA